MGASAGNILTTVAPFLDPVNSVTAYVAGRGAGNVSNDINKFGRDFTGVTARDAANDAANAQAAAQADAEKKIKDKELIASNQEEMRRKRRQAVGASGGQSTILTSGIGNIGSVQNGTKTFLGT